MKIRLNRFYIVNKTKLVKPELLLTHFYSKRKAQFVLYRSKLNPRLFEVIKGKTAKKYKIKPAPLERNISLDTNIYVYPNSHSASQQKKKSYRTITRRKLKKRKQGIKRQRRTNYFN